MKNADADDRDHLERNLEELLMRSLPSPVMPDSARAKIRRRLVEAGARNEPLRRARLRLLGFVHPWPRAVLATAALMVLVIVLWPGISGNGVSWADVQSRIAAARSLTAEMRSVELTPDGPREAYRTRIWFRDPGLSRSEIFPVGEGEGRGPLRPGERAESVELLIREPGQARQLSLVPHRRLAREVLHLFEGTLSHSRPLVDLAATAWERLDGLAASNPRKLGEQVVDGVRLVAFEAPVEEVFDGFPEGIADGVLRLWVSPDTAEPVRVELDFHNPEGRHFRTVVSNMAWDVPLADELFRPAVPPEWKLQRLRHVIRGFERTRLAAGVTLAIGPHGGERLTTAADVVGVVEGESTEELTSDMPRRVVITLELTSEAIERLATFLEEHPEELLVADWNGEMLIVPELRDDRTLRLQLTRLDKSLSEIEQQYFKEIEP